MAFFIIILLLLFSFFFYILVSINSKSFMVRPTIEKMVFYRDFALLTMVPYLYYLYGERYREHYILDALNGSDEFVLAAFSAVVFISFFMVSFYIFCSIFSSAFRRFRADISESLFYKVLNVFAAVSAIYFAYIYIKYDAGILGLFTGNILELNEKRHYLTSGGGVLSFNKIFIKAWIPTISYLYYYLYLRGVCGRFAPVAYSFLGLLASVFFYEKAVIFFYILGFVGVYIFQGGVLSRKKSLLLPVLGLLVLALMYSVTYSDKITDFGYLFDIIIHRIATQAAGSLMVYSYFESHEFFFFAGISNLLASVSGEEFKSVYSAMIDFYAPETAATSGALSSFAAGDAYGLFGFPGVLFGGIVVGGFYGFLASCRHSNFLSVIFVGTYAIYFSHHYVASGFYGFIWPVGLIYSIFPFVIVALISLKIK